MPRRVISLDYAVSFVVAYCRVCARYRWESLHIYTGRDNARETHTHSLVLPSFPFRMQANRWFREIEQRIHQGFSRRGFTISVRYVLSEQPM